MQGARQSVGLVFCLQPEALECPGEISIRLEGRGQIGGAYRHGGDREHKR